DRGLEEAGIEGRIQADEVEVAGRGAAEVVMLEREPRLAALLRQTQGRLRAAQVRIEVADALAWMRGAAPDHFDLICLDPPFDAGLFEAAIQAATPLLAPGGWLYLEADRVYGDADLSGLVVHRHGKAGAVHYHLLQPTPPRHDNDDNNLHEAAPGVTTP
ncbi:MAG TPA: RsmD family RNA methyltransferase, partial [Methylibium sp.]